MSSYTATTAFLETLLKWGISVVFANLGSDHPSFLEAFAEAKATGRKLPKVVGVAHEMVAMSAAQGYYQATARVAAVILHVDCGLQNAGGSMHNLFRARIPVLVFTGLTPLTQEGEMRGSRNEFIHWVQDNHAQPNIVREYSKYTYEFRAAANVPQVTLRALQIATTEPKGPVYLFGAREVMETELDEVWVESTTAPKGRRSPHLDLRHWQPVPSPALPPDAVPELVKLLVEAENPLVITSVLGRDPEAVKLLVKLSDQIALPVVEASPFWCNFPASNIWYTGNQWNAGGQNELLAKADVVLVLDSDVPWIPAENKPAPGATIIHIDIDPLKMAMPLFYIAASHRYTASARLAIQQLLSHLETTPSAMPASAQPRFASRREEFVSRHARRVKELAEASSVEQASDAEHPDTVSPAFALSTLARVLPENRLLCSEAISNYKPAADFLAPKDPRRWFTSGATSLGWNGGAAVGISYAVEKEGFRVGGGKEGDVKPIVCTVSGDGSWLFSVPTAVHALSSRMSSPILQVILCNGGWKSPKLSALGVHPHGYASRTTAEDLGVGFGIKTDGFRVRYAPVAVAAAGGEGKCWGAKVDKPEMLESVLRKAVEAVRGGRSAVVEVVLPDIE